MESESFAHDVSTDLDSSENYQIANYELRIANLTMRFKLRAYAGTSEVPISSNRYLSKFSKKKYRRSFPLYTDWSWHCRSCSMHSHRTITCSFHFMWNLYFSYIQFNWHWIVTLIFHFVNFEFFFSRFIFIFPIVCRRSKAIAKSPLTYLQLYIE